jgi:hypothetical protein
MKSASIPESIGMIKQFKARYPDSITEVFCEKVTPLGVKINGYIRQRIRARVQYFDTRQDAVKFLIEENKYALKESEMELRWAQEAVQEVVARISTLESEVT